MIEEVIKYLTQLPTPTTSPVYLAVNTPAMIAAMGAGVSAVTIYDTHTQALVTPYVKLQQSPAETNVDRFLGSGMLRTRVDAYSLTFECAAHGSTAYEAASRANYLALAVESRLQSLTYSTLDRADLGGSNGYDRVVRWFIETQQVDTPATGPGSTNTALWIKPTIVKLTIWVAKIRGA